MVKRAWPYAVRQSPFLLADKARRIDSCRFVQIRGQKLFSLLFIAQSQRAHAARIMDALEVLADDLSGDVKKLTNFTPEYRLRVGSYRILFEIENNDCVMVYRILHRREAYRQR